MTTPPIPLASVCWPGDQLLLPSPLADVVRNLADSLALPPAVGTAMALEAVAAAVGPAVVLRDDPAPPLAPSLHTLIAAAAGSTLPLALDAVLAPLRMTQTQLNDLAAIGPAMLTATRPHLGMMELRASMAPGILVEEAPFPTLVSAPSRAFDGCALATFSAVAWSRLWTELAATPNGSRHHLFHQAITGLAPLGKGQPHRTGTLNLLAEVRPDSEPWSGLVDLLLPDLCQRSLVLDVGLRPASPRGDAAWSPELAAAWADRLQQLFQLRSVDVPLEMVLAPEARATFRRFHAELVAGVVAWPARHHELVFGWPTLARRLALLLHLAAYADGPVSGITAETGVTLARFYGSHLVSLRDAAQLQLEQAALRADCARLLTALQQFPTATRRQLIRKFNGQSYERWNRALEALVRDGRVIQVAHDEFAAPESLLPASSSTV